MGFGSKSQEKGALAIALALALFPLASLADSRDCSGPYGELAKGALPAEAGTFPFNPVLVDHQSKMIQQAFARARGDMSKIDPKILDFWKSFPYLGVSEESSDLKSTLLRLFQERFPGSKIQLEEPGTAGMSGNPVFLLVNIDGKRLFAVKTYLEPKDLARELAGEETVRAMHPKSFDITRLAGAVQFPFQGKTRPLLIMHAVPGDDTRVTLTNLLASAEPGARQEAKAATGRVAKALAEMHRTTARPIAPDAPGNDFKEFELNRIRGLAQQLFARPEVTEKTWISATETERLKTKTDELIARYERQGMKRAGFLHGDFHAGNSFPGKEKAVLIDWEKSTTAIRENSAGALEGNADPVVDVARFVESFASDFAGTPGGREKAELIENAFLRSYLQETGWKKEEIMDDLAFHRLRYDYLQVGRETKISREQQCATLDLVLRRFGIRSASAPSPCPPR